MPQVKTIAVLAASPALTSILAAMLAAHAGLRVRAFDSAIALKAYMRLAPVDLLVADFDCATAPAAGLADSLVCDPLLGTQSYQIIALASDVTEAVRRAVAESGIDEVMVKPMSPKYLLERVQSRLRQRVTAQRSVHHTLRRLTPRPATPDYRAGTNVIQLWTQERPLPQH